MFSLGRELPAGAYQVVLHTQETEAYRSSETAGVLTIRPAKLTIRTLPPLPSIGFSLDGRHFYSNEQGIAQIEVATSGTFPLQVLPLAAGTEGAPVQIKFDRWADGVFYPEREVTIRSDRTLDVGFALSHQVGLAFVDRAGEPVDPARISSLTLKSSTGTRYTYSDATPKWRTANRVARLSNGLEVTPIQYSVESLIVDGTNVVNQNQQRYIVTGTETWTVELLLYSMRVRASDAVLGFPLGIGIELTYPDQHTKFFAFDENNEVYVTSLARGQYKVRVAGASGMAPLTPVSLSRDQDVMLKVLSTLDMALGMTGGIIAALGMLLYGRPMLVVVPVRWLCRLFVVHRSRPTTVPQSLNSNCDILMRGRW
jgi:hypothetical protein